MYHLKALRTIAPQDESVSSRSHSAAAAAAKAKLQLLKLLELGKSERAMSSTLLPHPAVWGLRKAVNPALMGVLIACFQHVLEVCINWVFSLRQPVSRLSPGRNLLPAPASGLHPLWQSVASTGGAMEC